MRPAVINDALQRTRSDDPRIRRAALLELCPCHVRNNQPEVWDRLFELQFDPDTTVRSIVLHNLCDGSPKLRRAEVVAAIERLAQDEDKMLRRRARRSLAIFRRTGRIVET